MGDTALERWDRELVAGLVSIGAKHETAFDDDRIPMFTWADSGPSHRVHLMGFREPDDGRWYYVIEVTDGPPQPRSVLRLTRTLDDTEDPFAVVADILNKVDGRSP